MNKYRVRLANNDDVNRINTICSEAKERIRKLGLSQWQKGYPEISDWENGIDKKEAHVVSIIEDNKEIIVGAFCLSFSPEEMYENIEEGDWLTSSSHNYIVLHRICVGDNYLCQGVSTCVFDFAKEVGLKNNKESIRIDTHDGNIPMKKSLKSNGFVECGKVYLLDGPEMGDLRIAYEYLF